MPQMTGYPLNNLVAAGNARAMLKWLDRLWKAMGDSEQIACALLLFWLNNFDVDSAE
jgi:hypothetical protein